MEKVRILEIKESVFADNDRQADQLRARLKEKGVFLMNLMSSPGSGKMTEQGIEGLGIEDVDLAILENVGNLVCPAEFDTGASKNVMILSVPEGHDKPLKYPLMFQVSDLVLINKIDTLEYFDFDFELAKERILKLNPNAVVLPVSAKTGEGLEQVIDWIMKEREKL